MIVESSRRGFLKAGAVSGVAGLAAGALPAEAASSFTEAEAVKAAIQAWTEALARRDFAGWIGFWTDDAVLMPPGHPRVEGHAALEAYAREDFPPTETFAFSDWRIEGQGDLAVVTNDIEWAGDVLKQVIVLRHVAGAWKVQIVMFNAGVAA